MKKFLVFALSVLASTSVFAYDHTFTVINISKDNVDATQNKPRIGDTLMFKLDFKGNQPVAGENIAVNVSDLKNAVSFTELTPGKLKGDMVEFPVLEESADMWEEQYAFYVRVKDTTAEKLSATFKNQTLTVPLNLSKETRCEDCEVPQTGPEQLYVWVLVAIALFGGILVLRNVKQK